MCELVIDDLTFTFRRSARRHTVGITVDRDGSLVLSAPADCPVERAEAIAREKRFWIYRKLAEKNLLFRPPPPREYVSGETVHDLGRGYRLKLVSPDTQRAPLRLAGGWFELRRDATGDAGQHFARWYAEHGRSWIARRVERLAPRIGVTPTSIEVRDLGYRWGSARSSGHGWSAPCRTTRRGRRGWRRRGRGTGEYG